MITASDLLKKYSVVAAAGDTTAGTASGSLGDQVSTTSITNDAFSNIFPDVTGDEALAGVVKYRCIFIHNNHASLTLQVATATITAQTAGGSTMAIASDNIAVSAKGSATAQAATIISENTAPSGVSAFGLGPVSLGNIGPGQVKALWIRQTTPALTTPPGSDGVDSFVLTIDGDSLP
jgi:hypothetical protein